jgi:hypothetical protein
MPSVPPVGRRPSHDGPIDLRMPRDHHAGGRYHGRAGPGGLAVQQCPTLFAIARAIRSPASVGPIFQVFEDGQVQTITTFDAVDSSVVIPLSADPSSPPSAFTVVDSDPVSGIAVLVFEELGPNGRRLASGAATCFVHDELGRADKAAVCVVGRALQTLTDLTSDKRVIGRWELAIRGSRTIVASGFWPFWTKRTLADETGGRFVDGTNDLGPALKRLARGLGPPTFAHA